MLQSRYISPTSKCRFSILNLRSSMCAFFWSRSPRSSSRRLRFCGDSSDRAMSWAISECIELPLTLWAGVGRAVVFDVIELVMLIEGSVVLGENCDGL